MTPQEYKLFLIQFLTKLEELTDNLPEPIDEKSLAQLRIAERSFNFMLDRFPIDRIKEEFGSIDEWSKLKGRRDGLASKLTKLIRADDRRLKRLESVCEGMKDPSKFGYLL